MRTRKSNKSKSFVLDPLLIEDDDEEIEESAAASSRTRRRHADASDHDSNFDEDGTASAQQDAPSEDDDSGEESSSVHSVDESERPTLVSTPAKKSTKSGNYAKLRTTGAGKEYWPLEPMAWTMDAPRGYAGSFERYFRGPTLVKTWYGPEEEMLRKAFGLLERWLQWPLLPPSAPIPVGGRKGVWEDGIYESEASFLPRWRESLEADSSQRTTLVGLSDEESEPYRIHPEKNLQILLGSQDDPQVESTSFGTSISIQSNGLLIPQEQLHEQTPSGWVVDAGGLVLNMDWSRKQPHETQLLALAVIPQEDQETYDYDQESARPDFHQHGTVQIWECQSDVTEGSVTMSQHQPILLRTICAESGRARRLKWSPACRHLAILCGDGSVLVIDPLAGGDTLYQKVEGQIAKFRLDDDVPGLSMTWVGFNRIAIGYNDGSVALWSVHPERLLSRHAVHHSPVIDMASGYPSQPYLVASVPIGGMVRLVDLRRPSNDSAEIPMLSVNTTPNILNWSEHLQGYFFMNPSSSIFNSVIQFSHYASFPVTKRVFTGDSRLTCLAIGKTHPFALIGTTDGSLWAINPQFEVMQLTNIRGELTERIKVFQHEHRPAERFEPSSPASQRGASRFMRGFKPEKSRHAVVETKKGKLKNETGPGSSFTSP
ncbi:uncharacterized protein J7T54_001010 [Emericellopsis cladophorae]|uniref:Uncharacterized protein n=1 Tax=Emericellopsis cladophorae TaxID=2686198 RepID=A0A9P9XXJ8_9HYPO|nr:uncharacterized protein J7T54_001010 [Emericellopsis cladophorae]KAI6779280.1 hypothetical protein J7T54_001010 [Emericellopsis cladophorae]